MFHSKEQVSLINQLEVVLYFDLQFRSVCNGAITFGDAPGVYAARPIFFLNSSVTYKSGLGTKDSPIILENWYSLRKKTRNGKNS